MLHDTSCREASTPRHAVFQTVGGFLDPGLVVNMSGVNDTSNATPQEVNTYSHSDRPVAWKKTRPPKHCAIEAIIQNPCFTKTKVNQHRECILLPRTPPLTTHRSCKGPGKAHFVSIASHAVAPAMPVVLAGELYAKILPVSARATHICLPCLLSSV